MKLNSAKEVWIARVIAWVVLGVVSCGIIFATTFILGPSLFAIPNLNDKIALEVFCPGAESSSTQEGASTPTTSDPNGPRGHTWRSPAISRTAARRSFTTSNSHWPPLAACSGLADCSAF